MHSNGNLISLALQQSFSSKKNKPSSIDDNIVASARRVLSSKIEYIHCPQYSTSSFLNSLKSKYVVLKPNKHKRKKKKKKKSKHKSSENSNNPLSQMKNTELNGENLSLPVPKIVLFSPDAVQLGWRGTVPVGSGLINLGTTCYINSTLQALFHVPSFINWLMGDKKHHITCEKMNGMLHTECIVCAMAKTLQATHLCNGSSVRPRQIIEKVKTICKHLSPFRQEDAHEFLRYLMEAMEKSYTAVLGIQAKKLDNFSKETTPLNQIFGGYIRTEVTCLECGHISTTFQHFQDLILDIRQPSTTTVYDALKNYFSKERLDGDESYHCEHCKKKVPACKQFSIEKPPNALCIQLKRFNISNFYGGSKISKLISIPQFIDLNKFKHSKKEIPNGTSSLKYRLMSMVFHHGPSVNSGHYTALGGTSTGSYYYFNDEQVYPTHLGQYTNNPNAYIMFYELMVEKSSAIENSCSVKTPTNVPAPSLTNGCPNGVLQQRNNGFFIKRENSFSTSLNHSKQPSWELNKKEEKSPMKSVVTKLTTPNIKSTSTSLVPYMSSESECSDSENDKPTDTNNNSRLSTNFGDKTKAMGSVILSPLAKKNSTLTSLLSSSPQNENSTYKVSSSAKSPLTNNKSLRLDLVNNNDDENEVSSAQNSASIEPKTEKRPIISFSLLNRDRKKVERSEMKHDNADNSRIDGGDVKTKFSKQMPVGVATVCFSDNEAKSESFDENIKGSNGSTEGVRNGDINYARTNGITNGGLEKNGTTMVNGITNGCSKPSTNGWIVTEVEEGDSNSNSNSTKDNAAKKLSAGDWIITEKGNPKTISSPIRDNKQSENRENSKKFNGTTNDYECNNLTRIDCRNISNSYPYSSQNGYGGKVHTWNGDLSYINKETELQRKEATKRNHSLDEEMDRGKVKKLKHYSRNENGSNFQSSPRKNPIQQYHNNYIRNKQAWHINQNNHHYYNNNPNGNNNNNNRRYSNNGYHKHNYYGYRHVNFVHQSNNYRR